MTSDFSSALEVCFKRDALNKSMFTLLYFTLLYRQTGILITIVCSPPREDVAYLGNRFRRYSWPLLPAEVGQGEYFLSARGCLVVVDVQFVLIQYHILLFPCDKHATVVNHHQTHKSQLHNRSASCTTNRFLVDLSHKVKSSRPKVKKPLIKNVTKAHIRRIKTKNLSFTNTNRTNKYTVMDKV